MLAGRQAGRQAQQQHAAAPQRPPDGLHASVAAAGAFRKDVHPLARHQARLQRRMGRYRGKGQGRGDGRETCLACSEQSTKQPEQRVSCKQPQHSVSCKQRRASHLRQLHSKLRQPRATLHRQHLQEQIDRRQVRQH